MHLGVLCAKVKSFDIPLSWILLDTYSTSDVSNNPALVKDIRTYSPEDRLTDHANGGEQVYSIISNLKKSHQSSFQEIVYGYCLKF